MHARAWTATIVGAALAGCTSSIPVPDNVRPVTAAAFAHAPGMPVDVVEGMPESEEAVGELPVEEGVVVAAPRIARGQTWTVDALVGQVNGRPVYASRFFESLEGSIRAILEAPENAGKRDAMRAALEALVRERFQNYIDSELVIAEAESMLTPEQQEGLVGFLRTMQEQTIAQRGGNRASAAQSLENELGMSIDQYMRQQRDEMLAQDLLQRRVAARVVVSWRDIVRAYRLRVESIDPSPRLLLGRLLIPASDTQRLGRAEELFAQGASFEAVVKELAPTDEGVLAEIVLPEGGIEAIADLSDAVKAAIRELKPGQVSAPVIQRNSRTWYCVVAVATPKIPSLWDPLMQLQVRGQITEARQAYQRAHYLRRLRDRWMAEDVDQMQSRLIAIAFHRYLPG